jgi:ubiquinone/menaquinone biosynthesis C-methylase UbiE
LNSFVPQTKWNSHNGQSHLDSPSQSRKEKKLKTLVLNSFASRGKAGPLPSIFSDLIIGYRTAKTLFSAVREGVFDVIGNKSATARRISRQLGWTEGSGVVFLDALVAIGFLTKERSRYNLPEISKRYLLRSSPDSLFHNLSYQDRLWGEWGNLTKKLRPGGRRAGLPSLLKDRSFTQDYIHAMDEISRGTVAGVVDKLPTSKGMNILDVGGGPGRFSREILQQTSESTATLVDFPLTIKIAKKQLSGFGNRVRFKVGNYHQIPFGDEIYDLALLSHVTHDEGEDECRHLIQKAVKSLKPGGVVAIHDFMLDEEKTASLFSALFSVHMLVYTERGRTYSRGQYRRWLVEAGCINLSEQSIRAGDPTETILMIGMKKKT